MSVRRCVLWWVALAWGGAVACGVDRQEAPAHAPDSRVEVSGTSAQEAVAKRTPDPGPSPDPTEVRPARGVSHGLQPCFTAALERNPQASGRVVVSWVIVDGAPTQVAARDDTTHDPRFADCLVEAVRGWPFKGAADGPGSLPVVISPVP